MFVVTYIGHQLFRVVIYLFGKVLGLSMTPMMLLMMAGPLFAGWMHDRIGDYDLAFYILAVISLIGSLGFLFAKKPEPIMENVVASN